MPSGHHTAASPLTFRQRSRRMLWWLTSVVIVAVTTVTLYVAASLMFGSQMPTSHTPQQLRIMSWNIGKVYLRWDSRAADKDLRHVASIIANHHPDLVGLQEIKDAEQLGRLVALLGPPWRGHVPIDSYDRRAAILSRHPIEFVELTTSTGRTAQGGIVTLPNGKVIALASVHLDAFSPERRLIQGGEVLMGLSRLGQQQIFLLGDFNFDPADLRDSSVSAQLYQLLTAELADAAANVGATTIYSRRIDYVFYRNGNVVRAVAAEVLKNRRINLMDHDPLVVDFQFL